MRDLAQEAEFAEKSATFAEVENRDYFPEMSNAAEKPREIEPTPEMVAAAVDAYFGLTSYDWEESVEESVRQILRAAMAATPPVSCP